MGLWSSGNRAWPLARRLTPKPVCVASTEFIDGSCLGAAIHPDDADGLREYWQTCLASGRPVDTEARIRRFDGVYRWFLFRANPLRDESGNIVKRYGTNIDIEDRKNVEEALRDTRTRLSRATQTATVGEFAASVAHEINQPLAAVVANGHACLRWLSAQPPSLAKAREAAERIVRDGKEAGEVVLRIRPLFKEAAAEKIELDINDVIGEVIRLLGGAIARRHVAVDAHLSENLAPVAGGRLHLQQLVFNLLLNGIEAMDSILDRPRKLFIRSRQPNPETVRVEVQDCGGGLQDPEKVFEAFFTTKENGMGMGLAICRSIIDAHQGRLWAEAAIGRGAMFSFTLPVQRSASS